MKAIKYGLCMAAMLLTSGLTADDVYMRGGVVLRGRVISQTRTKIVVRLLNGKRTIRKSDIKRLVYKPFSFQAEREKLKREKARREKAERARREEIEERRKQEAEAKAARRAARIAALEKKKAEEKARSAAKARKKARNTTKVKSLAGPWWRSAILPGWAHYSNHKRGLGRIYGGVFLATFLYSYTLRSAALNSASANTDELGSRLLFSTQATLNSGAPASTAAGLYYLLSENGQTTSRGAARSYERSLGILTIVYAIQLVHAFLDGRGQIVQGRVNAAGTSAKWSAGYEYDELGGRLAVEWRMGF